MFGQHVAHCIFNFALTFCYKSSASHNKQQPRFNQQTLFRETNFTRVSYSLRNQSQEEKFTAFSALYALRYLLCNRATLFFSTYSFVSADGGGRSFLAYFCKLIPNTNDKKLVLCWVGCCFRKHCRCDTELWLPKKSIKLLPPRLHALRLYLPRAVSGSGS